ncbi:PRC-barrel domain-containing protein [Aureimonas leprariae]|uniref:PRC-barrel domain-containing protein n=1 Tax=Plantimonas leprariae TaxID=2615207 RepID=A0A7V7PPF8_9HYPH|nr:PRC-barrel domain-containing protein [Aureimonas leprariae]KAB0679876.1 hypothetical protein F6X38_11675 [Aureimonas leprariae]
MTRTLLVSTALAGLLATTALAQNPAPAAPDAPASRSAASQAGAGTYARQLEAGQTLASTLTGASVYETASPDARSIGEIRNFVIGQGGKLAAVVVDTSGLDQNKTVAAAPDKVEWTKGDDGKDRVVLKAAANELQAAPAFMPQSPQDAAQNGAALPGSGAAAPAGGPADGAATNVTAAPTADTNAASNNAAGRTIPAAPAGVTAAPAPGYLAALANDQKLSQDIIGSNVYSGPADDAATIGSVNDLVLAEGGTVPVAVVGVGGFLGIGEKNVGVPYEMLTIQPGANSEPRLVMAATRDQLAAAPTFEASERSGQKAASESNATAALPAESSRGADTSTAADNGNASAAKMNADPATTASTNPSNDQSSLKPLTGAELTAEKLNGVAVYGPNDQNIGKVGDIALTADGRVDAVVVDVGGFLGIGSKPVAVAMENLQFMRDTNGTINIYTQFTQDQLKAAPEFNRETYADNRGSMRLQPAPAGSGSSSDDDGANPAQ